MVANAQYGEDSMIQDNVPSAASFPKVLPGILKGMPASSQKSRKLYAIRVSLLPLPNWYVSRDQSDVEFFTFGDL